MEGRFRPWQAVRKPVEYRPCRNCGCEIFEGNGHIWWHRSRDHRPPSLECAALSVAEPEDD